MRLRWGAGRTAAARAVRRGFLPFLVATLAGPLASAAGFERIETATEPPIAIGVWYPSDAAAPAEPNTPFRQALALGGAISGEDLPLVVLSHGDGGWMGGHAGTALALADAGYVVAAPEHPGNHSEDASATPREWLASRPRDVRAVIDHMLTDWPLSAHIDARRIGVFGFSAGGYTALAAAGGVLDLDRARSHCTAEPDEFVCRIGLLDRVGGDTADASDARIGAISVAAPALGFAFAPASLTELRVPVQVWSGSRDDRVPHATNGAPIAAGLPAGAEQRVVEGAGHFAFLGPCNPRLRTANPEVWRMVCIDAPGFDRAAFHRDFNREVVRFFDRALGD